MKTYTSENQKNQNQSVADTTSSKQSGCEQALQFVDNRLETVMQMKLQEIANNSSQIKQLRMFQDIADNSPQVKQAAQWQDIADNHSHQQQFIQKKANKTNLSEEKTAFSPNSTLEMVQEKFRNISTFEGQTIQTKLTLGSAGDKYEQQADAMAKQVVERIQSPLVTQRQEEEGQEMQLEPLSAISTFQRKQGETTPSAEYDSMLAGGEVSHDVETAIQDAKSVGQPIADEVRGPMEQAFGANFSSVKIHTDSQANTLNRSLNARAFTSGQNVFFRNGEYNPTTTAGQKLLAHELTHVVQQTGSGVQAAGQSLPQKTASPPTIQRTVWSSNKLKAEAGKPGLYSKTYKAIIKKLKSFHKKKNSYSPEERLNALLEIERDASAYVLRKLSKTGGKTERRRRGLTAFLENLGQEIRGAVPKQRRQRLSHVLDVQSTSTSTSDLIHDQSEINLEVEESGENEEFSLNSREEEDDPILISEVSESGKDEGSSLNSAEDESDYLATSDNDDRSTMSFSKRSGGFLLPRRSNENLDDWALPLPTDEASEFFSSSSEGSELFSNSLERSGFVLPWSSNENLNDGSLPLHTDEASEFFSSSSEGSELFSSSSEGLGGFVLPWSSNENLSEQTTETSFYDSMSSSEESLDSEELEQYYNERYQNNEEIAQRVADLIGNDGVEKDNIYRLIYTIAVKEMSLWRSVNDEDVKAVINAGIKAEALIPIDLDLGHIATWDFAMQIASSIAVKVALIPGTTSEEIKASIAEGIKYWSGSSTLIIDRVFDYILAHGFIDIKGEDVVVQPAGMILLGRVASVEANANHGREATGGEGHGYALLGIHSEHFSADRKAIEQQAGNEGSEIKRLQYWEDDSGTRQETILTMEDGRFFQAASGEVAKNPDWSDKSVDEILNSSPNHAHNRIKELTKGMPSNEVKASLPGVRARVAEEMMNNPRLIFVMDESGTFYATEGRLGEIHHSTFFAGKGIACAGEIGLSNGKPTYLSNASGHYMPGPLYLWQAVHALKIAGADVSELEVSIYGVSRSIWGDEFLEHFVPGGNLSGNNEQAINAIEAFLARSHH